MLCDIDRMHTLASPMILSVSPALQDIGRVKPSSGANTVSTTTGFDGLESGIRATKTLPLRVGFVSKFFGDEVKHVGPSELPENILIKWT